MRALSRTASSAGLRCREQEARPSWSVAQDRCSWSWPGSNSNGPPRPAFDDPEGLAVDTDLGGRAVATRLAGVTDTRGSSRSSARRPTGRDGRAGSALAAVRAAGSGEHTCRARGGDARQAGPCRRRGGAILGGGAPYAAATRIPLLARRFLTFLVDRRGAMPGRQSIQCAGPDTEDLLGRPARIATLVDAREELRAAWHAPRSRRAPGRRHPPLLWMTEPPPWPPASVEKIRARGGEHGEAMLADLAGQIADDPARARAPSELAAAAAVDR